MGDTMSKRVRLTGARTCDDQERSSDMAIDSNAMLYGSTLLRIERLEI